MKKIIFFSRGRGFGHAIPDMAIADEINRCNPLVDIRFASYAGGAVAFAERKKPFFDLGLPEKNPFLATFYACSNLILAEEPSVVVAHEEFAAIAAAVLHNIPAVFMSAWLPPAGTVAAESICYAKAVVVLGDPGIFPVPSDVRIKPVYTGPLIRPMKYTVRDRADLRRELMWHQETFCLVVVPGGSLSEAQSPIADLIVSAFNMLKHKHKRLIWISTKDHGALSKYSGNVEGFELISFCDPIERMLAVADVVISKGTRGITHDAAAVGVPTISLSGGGNSVDDELVPRIRTNIGLRACAVDADILVYYIKLISSGSRVDCFDDFDLSPLMVAANAIIEIVGGERSVLPRDSRAPSLHA